MNSWNLFKSNGFNDSLNLSWDRAIIVLNFNLILVSNMKNLSCNLSIHMCLSVNSRLINLDTSINSISFSLDGVSLTKFRIKLSLRILTSSKGKSWYTCLSYKLKIVRLSVENCAFRIVRGNTFNK